MGEHNGWCVLCMEPLGEEDMVPATLPDGCVAHVRCWHKATYKEVSMHGRPVDVLPSVTEERRDVT